MTTYSTLLTQCPDCQTKFTMYRMCSYNNYGAKHYTDGYQPMLGAGNGILKCPGCGKYYWERNLPILDESSSRCSAYQEKEPENSYPDGLPLSAGEYGDVLKLKMWENKKDERYIRTVFWWGQANRFGLTWEEKFSLSADQEQNMRKLLKLLGTNQNDTVIKAEIFRHLGEFKKCLNLLDRKFKKEYLNAVGTIRNLALSQESQVAEICYT